jgi:hypothetical protein
MHQSYSDAQDHRSTYPNPSLKGSQAVPVDGRVQMIVDAEEEEGHPSKQVKVRMGGES